MLLRYAAQATGDRRAAKARDLLRKPNASWLCHY